MRFTYGLELEYADVYRWNKLPEGCNWNEQDYSIVNSNGIANDPKGKIWKFGGEINTKPTENIAQQIKVVEAIQKSLLIKPTNNYKCNLHVHIGIPGMVDDLAKCKKMLRYIQTYCAELLPAIDPLPSAPGLKGKELAGFKKRLRRNRVSHHQMLPVKRYEKVMKAGNTTDFFNNFAPMKNGKPMWFLAPRPAVNLKQLQETETIEFRHFFGTLDLRLIENCLIWCKRFTEQALGEQHNPFKLFAEMPLEFPKAEPYSHWLQTGFELTNLDKNNKGEVKKLIRRIMGMNVLFICTGNINRSPAAEIILKNMSAEGMKVKSAALSPNNKNVLITKKMRNVLREMGFRFENTRSQYMTDELLGWADVIFYMDKANEKRIVKRFGSLPKFQPLYKYSSEGIEKIKDPHFAKGDEMHKVVAKQVADCCANFLKEKKYEEVYKNNRR